MSDSNRTNVTSIREDNINETCLYEFTEEQWTNIAILENALKDYGQLMVCVCGLFFNSITILLLFNKKLSGIFFNRLLLSHCIIASMYLIITLLEIWLCSSQSQEFFYRQYAFYFFVVPARGIIMCCTIYMTVILSLERYTSIVRPQPQGTGQVSWTQVLKFVAPVVLLCTLFKFPSFFELDTETTEGRFNNATNPLMVKGPWPRTSSENNTHNTSTISIVVTEMRIAELYTVLYINIANITVTGLIPLTLLAFFNFHIYKGIMRFHQRRLAILSRRDHQNPTNNQTGSDKTQAIVLFAIVLLFLLCHTLRILLNIEDLISHNTKMDEIRKGCFGIRYWVLLAVPVSEILLRLNSSLNFFIYCAFNKSFRGVISANMSKILNACGVCKCKFGQSMRNNPEHHELQTIQTYDNNR